MTNATWKRNPGTNDYDAGSNWSGGAVPDGTAFFGRSSTASLTFSVTTAIGGWTFKDTASNYSFTIPLLGLPFDGVTFVGAGIIVKGGRVNITNNENLKFLNASTAGIAHITNNGNVSFYDTSTAGSAKFTNDNFVQFFGSSTAGRAHFTNNDTVEFYNDSSAGKFVVINNIGAALHFSNSSTAGAASINNVAGDVDFYNSSNAGAAHITNAGDIRFHGTSSAANAVFTNVASGLVQFLDTSGAGTARISMDIVDFLDNAFASHARIAAHHLTFFDTTNAGAATITTVNGALTEFHDNSDGANARFITKAGGVVDFSPTSGGGGLNSLQAGSIEGAGSYKLGGNDLYVGYNNRSTNVSGAIDGTAAASLHKVGTGTLKLSHAFNSYASGTYIDQGILDVAVKGGAGGGVIFFQIGRQTLKIENAALSNHAFGNTVEFFGAGDKIDLAGLKFVTHAKATYNQGTEILTVHSGKVTDTLELADPSVLQFKVVNDGHGGCKIIAKPAGAKEDAPAGPQHALSADRATDSFQFKHQEAGRHSTANFDLHSGLGTELLALSEHVWSEPYLANFHIDVPHAASLGSYDFTM